ncbi:MAG: TonB-dependent receptor plug domain-containing protein [Deltaproteobacteria bacterium]|nr:TonB-dependent receptor plug domain-containing protein [Deltaproteobacteria bacterium]
MTPLHVDLGAIPAEMIVHLTVVKGPASLMYGPNGPGGVVNAVTRRPGRGPLAEARVEGAATGGGGLRLSGRHSASAEPGVRVRGAAPADRRPACADRRVGAARDARHPAAAGRDRAQAARREAAGRALRPRARGRDAAGGPAIGPRSGVPARDAAERPRAGASPRGRAAQRVRVAGRQRGGGRALPGRRRS